MKGKGDVMRYNEGFLVGDGKKKLTPCNNAIVTPDYAM